MGPNLLSALKVDGIADHCTGYGMVTARDAALSMHKLAVASDGPCGCGNDECAADALLAKKITTEKQIAALEDGPFQVSAANLEEWKFLDNQLWLDDRAFKIAARECDRRSAILAEMKAARVVRLIAFESAYRARGGL